MATVEMWGETFALREKVPEWAMFKFAKAAVQGQDGDTLQGMASMLALVEKCLTVEDWPRFDRLADENDASSEEALKVIMSAFEQVAERPTGRSSDSSDGPSVTPLKSVSNFDDRALERFAGRPDIQAGLIQMRQTREAASA